MVLNYLKLVFTRTFLQSLFIVKSVRLLNAKLCMTKKSRFCISYGLIYSECDNTMSLEWEFLFTVKHREEHNETTSNQFDNDVFFTICEYMRAGNHCAHNENVGTYIMRGQIWQKFLMSCHGNIIN